MDAEVQLNLLSSSYPGWRFYNYDYVQGWETDDTRTSKVVIFGSRTIQFPIAGGHEDPEKWHLEMFSAAIRLSLEDDRDLLWRAQTPSVGRWAPAGLKPDEEMLEDLDLQRMSAEELGPL